MDPAKCPFRRFSCFEQKIFLKKTCQNDRPISELVKGFENKKVFYFHLKISQLNSERTFDSASKRF